MTAMMTVADIMLAAHDIGLCVVPPRDDGSKAPVSEYLSRTDLIELIGLDAADQLLGGRQVINTWKHWQVARPSRELVEVWARRSTGVGLLTGSISGGLELFEFDDAE